MIKFSPPKARLVSEINILPFTDVVLVILVIFMIATPLLIQSALGLDLPKTQNADASPPSDVVLVEIDRDSTIKLNGRPVEDVSGLTKALGLADLASPRDHNSSGPMCTLWFGGGYFRPS